MYITALLLLLTPLTLATHLSILIPASPLLPNPSTLPPSTTATLTTLSTVLRAPLRLDNTFDFRNVSAGSYLLDIHCATHGFAPLRVDVHDGSVRRSVNTAEGMKSLGNVEVKEVEVWGTFRGNEWANKGEVVPVRTEPNGDVAVGENMGQSKVYRFEAKVLGGKEYFLERSGFSPLSLLKNPMILIAGVTMLLVFGMPYLMDNMDPELKAEFEERQKSSALGGGQAANPLQNFDAAAWLAGSSAGSKKSESVVRSTEERGVTR